MLVLSFENVSFDPELPDGMMLAKVRGGQELSWLLFHKIATHI